MSPSHIMCVACMLHYLGSSIMLLLDMSSHVLLLKHITLSLNGFVLFVNVIRSVFSSGSWFSSKFSSIPAASYNLYSSETILTTSLLFLVVLSILLFSLSLFFVLLCFCLGVAMLVVCLILLHPICSSPSFLLFFSPGRSSYRVRWVDFRAFGGLIIQVLPVRFPPPATALFHIHTIEVGLSRSSGGLISRMSAVVFLADVAADGN